MLRATFHQEYFDSYHNFHYHQVSYIIAQNSAPVMKFFIKYFFGHIY